MFYQCMGKLWWGLHRPEEYIIKHSIPGQPPHISIASWNPTTPQFNLWWWQAGCPVPSDIEHANPFVVACQLNVAAKWAEILAPEIRRGPQAFLAAIKGKHYEETYAGKRHTLRNAL